ncbi:hypothetical protein DOY81_011135, partial [Sarcophaga bullata]
LNGNAFGNARSCCSSICRCIAVGIFCVCFWIPSWNVSSKQEH